MNCTVYNVYTCNIYSSYIHIIILTCLFIIYKSVFVLVCVCGLPQGVACLF